MIITPSNVPEVLEELSRATSDPVPLKSVSVSQTNTFARCNRKWFFNKLRKLQAPQRKSAALGTEVHNLIEGWFKRGFIPKGHAHEDKARAAVAHLPPPSPGQLIEHPFVIQDDSGLPPFKGVIDFVDQINFVDRSTVYTQTSDRSIVRIVDHKTTGQIERLRDNRVDLTSDPQMLSYAEWAFRHFGNDVRVTVAHNTISSTHKARVLPLNWTNVDRSFSLRNWQAQTQLIRAMVNLCAAPPTDFNEVSCNPQACGDYGGCEYLPLCSIKNPYLGVTMDHDPISASDLLKRLAGLTGATTTAVEDTSFNFDANTTASVQILPPDAAPRETAVEPETVAAAPKEKKARKARSDGGGNSGGNSGAKYEYKIEEGVIAPTESDLNARAQEGWELVCFHDGINAVYKRSL